MKVKNLIEKLTNVEPTKKPFISVYLNAESNDQGRDDFDAFLKKQLSVHQNKYEEHTPERESFDRDLKRITEYSQNIPASANGVAIFACAGENDFFETKEFDVPFENDGFFVFNRPHIFPLARLYDQNPKYAIVAADTNAAKIHVFKRKKALEIEEIDNLKTNRKEQGVASARYQNHIDNFHKQHAKEVIEELNTIVRDENIEQIILVGDEKVIIPLLKDELTDFLEKKIIGTLRLNIDTPEHELLEETEKVIHRNDTLVDKQKIDQLMEQHYDEGLGITGVEKTFAALANGQVNELYINAKFDEIKYDDEAVQKVIKAYAPGIDDALPKAEKGRLMIDELIKLGLYSAEKVRFIEDENLLKDHGGIGALLRYRTDADLVNKATS